MIRTLTGSNSYGIQTELHKITDNFIREHGDLALEQLDGEEVGLERIQEAVQSLPFLASSKLVILRTPSANKQFLEHYEAALAEVPDITEVIIHEPKIDKRGSYYKWLKKNTEFQEYAELDERGLAKWAVEFAKGKGVALSLSDASYLIGRVGANQQKLANELTKLTLSGDVITRQVIDELTEPTPQSTIFELIDAAFSGNKQRALDLYDEQRALKVEPQQIIAMLAWQLHVLAVIKAAGERSPDAIAKEAKISPFVVRKSSGIARKLSLTELKQYISDLAQLDSDSKRTALDLDEALKNYILHI